MASARLKPFAYDRFRQERVQTKKPELRIAGAKPFCKAIKEFVEKSFSGNGELRSFRLPGIQLLASPTKMSDFERGSEQVLKPSRNTAAREPDQNERF